MLSNGGTSSAPGTRVADDAMRAAVGSSIVFNTSAVDRRAELRRNLGMRCTDAGVWSLWAGDICRAAAPSQSLSRRPCCQNLSPTRRRSLSALQHSSKMDQRSAKAELGRSIARREGLEALDADVERQAPWTIRSNVRWNVRPNVRWNVRWSVQCRHRAGRCGRHRRRSPGRRCGRRWCRQRLMWLRWRRLVVEERRVEDGEDNVVHEFKVCRGTQRAAAGRSNEHVVAAVMRRK